MASARAGMAPLTAGAAATAEVVLADVALVRGGRLLFEGLSLTVAPGEALLLRGANGAGKTSLLRLVAGLLAPTAGRIDNPFRMAAALAEPALKPGETVAAELAWWAGLDEAPAARVAAAADAMAITPLLPFRCGMLSSGQRQRVSLARVIASGAALWLLDEPTATLDAASADRLLAAIEAHRATGGLVVAATHADLPLVGARTLRL